MKRTWKRITLLKQTLFVIWFVISCLSQALATSYDAVTDFSSSTNTKTSTWSYRFATDTIRDGSYSLLPTYGPLVPQFSPPQSAWAVAGNIPFIGVNQTGSDATFIPGPGSGPFTWPNNTMLVHPGANPGLVVLSWLSPSTGFFDINFSFTDRDPNGGNGINWYVDKNATDLASGGVFAPSNPSSGLLSLNNVFVPAGARINFIVDPNGDFFFDSTGITATITSAAAATPDTGSTLELLLGAFIAMLGIRFFIPRLA